MTDFEFAKSCIGTMLLGLHEEALGIIDQVYLDPERDEVRWARVFEQTALREVYVPMVGVQKRSRALFVGLDEAKVRAAPPADSGTALSAAYERMLWDYYAPPGLGAAPALRLPGEKTPYIVVGDRSATVMGGGGSGHAETTGDPDISAHEHDATHDMSMRRYLHGRGPERVALGVVASLQVRVVIEPGSDHSSELKPFEIPPEGVDVLLLLHHPGFEARSSVRQIVHVPPDAASDVRLFEVEATREGVHSLVVSAFRDGAFLGELTFQLTVEAGLSAGRSIDVTQSLHSLSASEGEVSLLINYDPEKQVYSFQFLSNDQLDEGITSERLLAPPKAAVEALVADLNRAARGASPFDGDRTRRWLQDKGIGLWQTLIPEGVRRQFWERRDRITSLTIVSAQDLVPWELLYPLDASPNEERGFLAEQFPVMRWVYGGAKVRDLAVADAAFVMPEGSPTTAAAEIATVRKLLDAPGGPPIADLDGLLARLDGADFDVLHFACHNTFDAQHADRSTVRMAGGPFELSSLNRHKATHALRGRAPLVFMNACRSAGAGEHYTEVTSWAQAFVQAGAGAFIGSLWEVRDTTASAFAEAFYDTLLVRPKRDGTKVTLGEAIQTARAAIANRPGDPTWLAYTVYGTPGAMAA